MMSLLPMDRVPITREVFCFNCKYHTLCDPGPDDDLIDACSATVDYITGGRVIRYCYDMRKGGGSDCSKYIKKEVI